MEIKMIKAISKNTSVPILLERGHFSYEGAVSKIEKYLEKSMEHKQELESNE